MTRMSNVYLQKRFPVIQIESMCRVAGVCRNLAQSVDLESLLVDWERVKLFRYNSTLLLGNLLNHSNNSSYLAMLVAYGLRVLGEPNYPSAPKGDHLSTRVRPSAFTRTHPLPASIFSVPTIMDDYARTRHGNTIT